ncbi:dihydroxyacetone kinase subunit L [Virgibacillus pantothenticus]|uniref:phosphoenolpyruvate--glycerone phosphotransferase n=1 Tax=Virgibacillus pantothenticus TaxID=1473 RepID=A0A0L0QLZ4_VIRPA|nr:MULTISPECIES: dihydroxyacetone kinase subunit DhaL [Virgibacillus]API93346.1 dihydroxyacetone kinase subunit L [Virgibacillus sp. 6R]KNE19617.1 dihydroxyacetone kinase [Virgibacillus pantothenticus]MBS7428600.1 dihydroxyacetone kinase subunit L [Virgibacillus sp. 19R1-5]MBU8567527.1 dihydroxyacetone kinase subunit L [Virgibacillus pantothenticus]MBU8601316.1 dihydroxyacetone kinase subunit L [Virgibacillus pantothenticus]
MRLDVNKTIQWMQLTNEKMQANKDYLTTLDQPIGDGDHGINMARGFQEVASKLNESTYTNVSDVLKDVAMTLMSKVGGASGPLFGTAFLKLSTKLKGEESVKQDIFGTALTEAVNGLKQRGKAEEGEKTMVDMWAPIAQLFLEDSNVTADTLLSTADSALTKIKEMTATKGRAAYFKDKTVGHQDPGAASTYLIFEALAEVWKGDSER